jgi:hypothetical protein
MKEGGGGDNLAVTWQIPGGPAITTSNLPISGTYIASPADPFGAAINITQQPSSLNTTQNANATFSVVATGSSASGTPLSYQWQRNNGAGGAFADIAGATSANYVTTPVALADSGAQFRVVLFVPGATATSSVATLTVSTPAALTMTQSNGVLNLSWNTGARLQYTTSLTPPVIWRDVDTGGATNYTVTPSNEFSVVMNAAQENVSTNTSQGLGIGTISLSNNVLKVNVLYTNLAASRSADHFHAPAPRGQNTAVVYDLASITTGTTNGTVRGDVPLVANQYGGKSIAAQIQDIRDGLWYLNIHTTIYGGGEIRGQVESGARFYRLTGP